MAKAKVLRQSQKHQVKMQDGSNIAQSKPAPKVGPREDPEQNKAGRRQPIQPGTVRAVSRITPSPTENPVRRRTPLGKPTTPAAPAPSKPKALTPAQLWSPDEAVLNRMNDLRLRNAQLAEQLDRLTTSSNK